jgi:hypothetical protein
MVVVPPPRRSDTMLAISSRELRAPRRNGTPSWRGCHDDEVARSGGQAIAMLGFGTSSRMSTVVIELGLNPLTVR